MAKYFLYPFGIDGDRTTIPETTQPDGSVNYDEGFGPDYQLDPDTDPDALNVPRDQFNELMYQVTLAIQQYQQFGIPDFITTSDNGGTPFEYSAYAWVRYSGLIYYSLEDANTALPTDATKWQVFPTTPPVSFQTADVVETYDSTLPSGWLWLDGKTIGSATSGATARANADTINLYTALWNSIPNSALPIQDSSGTATTRGASAAADFSADKRLPVPDKRGRVAAGKDDMGGTAANRMTSGGSGIAGTTLGAAGGDQTVQLTSNQNGSHTHSATTASAGAHSHNAGLSLSAPDTTGSTGYGTVTLPSVTAHKTDTTPTFYHNFPYTSEAGTHTHTVTVASSGLGSAHQNTQPTIMSMFRIKL